MDNRQAILDSALTLFYEKGYDAVGVQQIVDAAGVTKPTLYYYFGSKQGLLSCLLEEQFSRLETQMEKVKDAPEKIQDKLYHAARIFFKWSIRRTGVLSADARAVLFRKKERGVSDGISSD